MLKVSKFRWDTLKEIDNWQGLKKARIVDGRKYVYLDRDEKFVECEVVDVEMSPIYGAVTTDNPWEGNCPTKPWEYAVTAVIPVLNTSETLPICIELLRLQTVKPFIMIIDTGSIEDHLRPTLALKAEDVEVHTIGLNGVRHPSDYPAMAMDMAFSLCRTEYLFATHADCFLRKRNLLEELIELCKTKSPAVGYELSPRAHPDWEGMLSHTASMYQMKTMDSIGFGWSLRRLCHRYNIVDYKPDPMKPNWPDTEILGNYIMQEKGIKPYLIGKEGNQARTLDDNIDHFRSYTAGKMYSPGYYETALGWYNDARKEALDRIERWREEVNYQEKLVKHLTFINYENGLDGLAEDLGNLRYDTLAEFLHKLATKIEQDAKADEGRERHQLAKQLTFASKHIGNAWKICKNYMK